LDSILAAEGVEGTVTGRALSTDLGRPGQISHPEDIRRVERRIAVCQEYKKIPALLVQGIGLRPAVANAELAKPLRNG
jgi:2-keto-3-deoxy-L-rhamnonate aldolase RhmA